MIHTLQHGVKRLAVLLFLIFQMNCEEENKIEYSSLTKQSTNNFNDLFPDYCKINSTDWELNAVLASLIGDHKSSIYFASKRAETHFSSNDITTDSEELALAKQYFNKMASDTSQDEKFQQEAKKMLALLNRPSRPEELFSTFRMEDARKYIAEAAVDYHFTLINEAHYSSMNRAFTTQLLKPLWDKGYRYLALEALGHNDPALFERGYPILVSGYYLRESTFGNLIRDALEIGYQLVSYESKKFRQGTLRDRDQAFNIVQNTWEKDKVGKVLVHVGYSHLNEVGDNAYQPMGAQLKQLIGQDILTVEQQAMLPMLNEEKMHPYYLYVQNNYEFEQPIVFVNEHAQSLIDPINFMGTDVQVYHPFPKYTNNRPDWLLFGEYQLYKLPDEVYRYKDHLMQVIQKGEEQSAVPVDQFIIKEGSGPIVKPGDYQLKIIDCEGNLIASLQLNVQPKD